MIPEPVSFTERSCRLENCAHNVPTGGTEVGGRPDKVDGVEGMGRFISVVTGGTEYGGRPDKVNGVDRFISVVTVTGGTQGGGWTGWTGLFLPLRVALRG